MRDVGGREICARDVREEGRRENSPPGRQRLAGRKIQWDEGRSEAAIVLWRPQILILEMAATMRGGGGGGKVDGEARDGGNSEGGKEGDGILRVGVGCWCM